MKERIGALEGELDLKMKREKDRHQIEIMSLKTKVNSAENTVEECQEVIERQAEKIVKLEITLADTTTAATDALEMAKEAEEEKRNQPYGAASQSERTIAHTGYRIRTM